jgi:transcription-repair coupling factor (superfamily II helicase)
LHAVIVRPINVSLRTLAAEIAAHEAQRSLQQWADKAGPGDSLAVRGSAGSLQAFLIAGLASLDRPILCLTPAGDGAAYLASDLEQIVGPEAVVRFPETGARPYDPERVVDTNPLIQRADVLRRLQEGFDGLIVAGAEALSEQLPPPSEIEDRTIVVATGSAMPPEEIIARLTEYGFAVVEFVEEPGEIARRGGILDVYPFSGEYPIRIEYFGDEVDSIREFDPRSQRSVSRLTVARITPDLEWTSAHSGTHESLFTFLPPNALVVLFDELRLRERLDECFHEASEAFASAGMPSDMLPPEEKYLHSRALSDALDGFPRIQFGMFPGSAATSLHVSSRPQPSFNSNMFLLKEQIEAHRSNGVRTHILCDSRAQEVRLRELLEPGEDEQAMTLSVESLHEGFELPEARIAVYTDHQIFNRYHRPTSRKRKRQSGGLTLRELKGLTPGDFVVHIDHGIGKFAGMEKIIVRDRQQEAVRVLFDGEDVLYVNVAALHKLHKYSGKEGHQPRLTRLGSGQWEKAKARTKKRVKDIARDLIKLYARRKASRGHAFSPDTIWQREMEASFRYEDTPDQATAAEAVKQDMEEAIPMDRLVCGDVGFGKTEVAIRAAFKAVQDGKQAAVLVPTTILAAQHFETFTERLKNFPVKIEALSRFRTASEQKDIARRAASGDVDILIGTHRIAAKDVKFKNLGLLVIDEEQRFGVAIKERLRQMRSEVDTLTLTATPIPRTLQFSLMGARDLSIINTPPPNRQPIVTEIHTFDKNLIRDAILHETSRGGQVFFIHNRVQSIDEMATTIRMLVPDIRIRVAHGQMKGPDLEDVMHAFMDRKFDVLVSTNIIESGLDIPNANTIVINNADRFGLAELHQLRGRVGRSDRKAFCYLLVRSVHTLTREARQRLQAVEEFSDLGSGFNIAMRDLDIRGAGNMLGAEQTGFIDEVGFDTYHRILDEAVQELREEEFADLFDTPSVPKAQETVVDVEEDALIPEHYLANNVERLNLYRRISEAAEAETLEEIRAEMFDRFGPIPEEVDHLIRAAEMRLIGQRLRLPKVTYKNRRLFLEFPKQEADPYFYEALFQPLLARLAELSRRYVLKESSTTKKLRAIVQEVDDLAAAFDVLTGLSDGVESQAPEPEKSHTG